LVGPCNEDATGSDTEATSGRENGRYEKKGTTKKMMAGGCGGGPAPHVEKRLETDRRGER
jgi:hypothetical protein